MDKNIDVQIVDWAADWKITAICYSAGSEINASSALIMCLYTSDHVLVAIDARAHFGSREHHRGHCVQSAVKLEIGYFQSTRQGQNLIGL